MLTLTSSNSIQTHRLCYVCSLQNRCVCFDVIFYVWHDGVVELKNFYAYQSINEKKKTRFKYEFPLCSLIEYKSENG